MPITIVTGPPGAGKTTVSTRLAQSRPLAVHLVGDEVFHWIVSGYVPPWLPGTRHQNGTVMAAMANAAAQFARGGYDVFVDGIIGPWFLPPWLNAAPDPTQYVILRPDRQVALARATERQTADALVEPEPVARMFDAFEDLGAFEAHVVDSSGQDVDATVEAVDRELRRGSYRLDPLAAAGTADISRLAARFGIEPPTQP